MSIYLDYAGIGIVREPARAAMRAAIDHVLPAGSAGYGVLFDARVEARRLAATLLDCTPDDVALTPNTSAGLQLVADGLDWRRGDEVVVFERDFGANIHPWRRLDRHGVRLRWVPMRAGGYRLEDIAAAIGPATRLVAVSQVNFCTGFRIDLDAVCAYAAAAGALVSVDAVQGLGVVPLSVRSTPVDFLSAGGHKWLCAPPGTGVFYCRPDRLELLGNASYGWFGYDGAATLLRPGERDQAYPSRPRPSAHRFEGAMANFVGICGLAGALGELTEIGVGTVAERVRRLTARLRGELRERGYRLANPDEAAWSGIVGFTHPRLQLGELRIRMADAAVQVSYPGDQIRAAPHYWTTDDDLDTFIALL